MYKELKKIKISGSFLYNADDQLETACNAPNNASGIFMVYEIKDETKTLIMVGSTGTIQNDGSLKIKSGGLYDKIVEGHQFAKTGRKYTWPTQMQKENIEQLEVVWYDTFNAKNKVIPTFLEAQMLQNFLDENGTLPRWNVAF